MPPLGFDTLQALCQRHELPHKANLDSGQIAILHRILDHDAPLYAVPRTGRGVVAFVLPLPFRVPAERAAAIGEAIARLNAAAALVAWVLDAATGELAVRVALPVHGAAYDDDGVLFVLRVIASAAAAAAADLQQIALAGKASFELWPRPASVPVG